jgi:hypothetical protein
MTFKFCAHCQKRRVHFQRWDTDLVLQKIAYFCQRCRYKRLIINETNVPVSVNFYHKCGRTTGVYNTSCDIHDVSTQFPPLSRDDSCVPEELPEGWEEDYTQDGLLCYFSTTTGESTFDDPRQLTQDDPNDQSDYISQPLPSGWEEMVTQNGRTYYVDHKTNTLQLDDPRTLVASESTPPSYTFDIGSQVTSTLNPGPNNYWTRVKCTLCPSWFDNQQALEKHRRTTAFCEEHEVCYPMANAYGQAQERNHTRCFITTCDTKYRRDGGWQDELVAENVWQQHCGGRCA